MSVVFGQADLKERKKLIEHMLEDVERHFRRRGLENEFIESLRMQFDDRGNLSDKQIDALRKYYERTGDYGQ